MNKYRPLFRKPQTFTGVLVLSVILIFVVMTLLSGLLQTAYMRYLMGEMDEFLIDLLEGSYGETYVVINEEQLKYTLSYQVFVLFSTGLSLALGGLLFYFVIRRLLHPLKQFTARISAWDIQDTNYLQLPELPRGNAELTQLVGVYNQLLARLYDSYERQKAFSGNIAHELRTPLAILLSEIQVYGIRPTNDNESRRFVQNMEKSVRRLADMVESILYLSVDTKPHTAPVRVMDLVEEIWLDLETKAGAKKLLLTIENGEQILWTDETLLQRLLHNLLENAVLYTTPDSAIAVTCRQSEKEHRITVSDTGLGISDEDKTRVFDLFYRCQSTGTPPTEGSGIGLSLVARIAQRLGGHITLTDHHPQGTAFTLHLPKERGQA
jgi:signal transduction histidine kinase